MRRILLPNRKTTVLVALAPLAAVLLTMPASCGLDVQGGSFDNRGSGGSNEASSSSSSSNGSSSGSTSSSTSSTSSSTSGASSSSSSSGGSGGTGGSVSMPEDCLDGFDNDLNGKIDCEDDACIPGFQCVAAAPQGWAPVRAFDEPYANPTNPACPPETTAHSFVANPNKSACTACSCAPNEVECDRPTLTCWYDDNKADCTQGMQVDIMPSQDACSNEIPSMQAKGSAKASCMMKSPSQLKPGTECVPNPVSQVAPDPFALRAYTCENPVTGGGCGPNQICVPKAPGSFQGSVCIAKSGNDACPGNFPTSLQAYDSGVDARTCDCACPNVVMSCANTGQIKVTDHDDCGGSSKTFMVGGACQDVTGQLGGNTCGIEALMTQPLVKQGSCDAAVAGGSVAPSGPTKICCK